MSLLSDFLTTAHAGFKTIVGSESITIGGGAAITGTLGEASFSRDYETGGFEQDGAFEFVIDRTTFAASYPEAVKSYEGKAVVARGENWRIKSIYSAPVFIRISLIPTNKSA